MHEPTICHGCGEELTFPDDSLEPTDYCHNCAQVILPVVLLALKNLLIDAGEGGRRGRAIDLLPKATWKAATAAVKQAEAHKPVKA